MDEGQTRHLNCFISPLMLNLIDKVPDELILMKLRSCINIAAYLSDSSYGQMIH